MPGAMNDGDIPGSGKLIPGGGGNDGDINGGG